MTVCYTYLVGWSKENKWYYGVRFADGCHPDDLWIKYYTSSRRVKNLRETLGDPDIIEVRKTFDDKNKAIDWEQKVLRRIDIKKKHWLNCQVGNQFINKGGYRLTQEQRDARKGRSAWNKGVSPSPEAVQKAVSNRKKGNYPAWNKGLPRPDRLRKLHSEMMQGSNNPMYGKSAVKNKKWYTNGTENIYQDMSLETPKGFRPGRYCPWHQPSK